MSSGDDFTLLVPTVNSLNKVYAAGSVFDSDVMLGAATNYRAWHLLVSAAHTGRREYGVKIVFRHNPTTGVWVLIINGDIKAKRAEKTMEKEFIVSFKFHTKIFELKCSRSSTLKHTYTLCMDGLLVKEIRDKADIYLSEQEPQVSITEVRTGVVKGKVVTMYQITCQVGGEKVQVERRYSDFVMLHSTVKGYTGNHMLATLPHLPGKVLNPFFNQSAPEFLAQRREMLQNYLVTLLNNSKVALYTEVFCFLGLDPISCVPLAAS